jgi:hypothetical protein
MLVRPLWTRSPHAVSTHPGLQPKVPAGRACRPVHVLEIGRPFVDEQRGSLVAAEAPYSGALTVMLIRGARGTAESSRRFGCRHT